MKRSETFGEFSKAFAKFQAEVTNPKMTAENPYFNSKYSPLSEVLNTVRPPLTKNGLSVYQDVASQEDQVIITTTIFHESGEWLESSPLILPAHQKLKNGNKEFNAQGAGSAISYAKRYQLQAALGIAADEEDDGEGQGYERSNQYVPNNLIGTPSEATLKAKYQLLKGSVDGFKEYMDKMRNEKQYDDNHIERILTQAIQDKHQEKQQGA